ncbi:low temperature requirement protein A [Micromonospora sp. NPDC049497]|uniref:low temperature requirement protein A n=1 Tax=Micromonospora sp. NPDC049497 TaxID=3364273 RepID=UPI0037BB8191
MNKAGSAGSGGRGPGLPLRERSDQQASFVELFFDLVLVFALNRVVAASASGLASAVRGERWDAFLRGLLVILPLMWVWATTSYGTARFDPRRTPVQLVVLVSALGVLLLGAAIPAAFNGAAFVFAGTYVALQAGRSLALYLMLQKHKLRRLYLRSLIWFSISAVPWLLGAATQGFARNLLWTAAIAIDLVTAQLGWPLRGMGRVRITAWAYAPQHLADRSRQLLMIALGETILAVGIAYTGEDGLHNLTATLGLLIAFLTTVLLWRIYWYTAGELFGAAVESARNPARLGRIAQTAHFLMILGVVATAAGHELVQVHPTGRTDLSWLAVIVGGPAAFVAGRAVLEWVVFSRVSRSRLLGIAALLVLAVPLAFTAPLAAVAAVSGVLVAIAAADARRAARNPAEAPAPAGRSWRCSLPVRTATPETEDRRGRPCPLRARSNSRSGQPRPTRAGDDKGLRPAFPQGRGLCRCLVAGRGFEPL